MKTQILSIGLLTTFALFASGCSTSSTNSFAEFSNILSDVMPYVNESERWDAYGKKIAQQGVTYASASSADMQFVSNKMDREYAAAINRLASPFARSEKNKTELAQANQNYVFKYNQVRTVKDKQSGNTLGYCVNYDRLQNGQANKMKEEDKLFKQFIFVAKDQPISAATASSDFTKRVCGTDFYTQYKNPKD